MKGGKGGWHLLKFTTRVIVGNICNFRGVATFSSLKKSLLLQLTFGYFPIVANHSLVFPSMCQNKSPIPTLYE